MRQDLFRELASQKQVILSVPRGQASLRRIQEVLCAPLAIEDPDLAVKPAEKEISLTFEHMYFRYNGAEQNTLSGIGFTVRGGQAYSG